jgi:ribosomal protein S18 acetylase RimI-like enzyme
MKITFTYNEDSDIDCLLSKGPGSKNRPDQQTKTYAELLRYTSDIKNKEKVREFVRKYIQEHKLNLSEITRRLQVEWDKVGAEFERRAELIFGMSLDKDINAFLTITGRFPYNIERNLFFVPVLQNSANRVAMHELWHFYTWYKFGNQQNKLGAQNYNDIKESLTVLLNLECTDLMDEDDKGYPQHQDLRAFISDKWLETKNIDKVWCAASEYLEKSKITDIMISKAIPSDAMGIQVLTAEASKGMYKLCGWSDEDISNHFTAEKIKSGSERLEQAISSFTESNVLIVAKDSSGKIVGCCFAERKADENRIEAVYVYLEYQGTGLSKKLYDEAFKKLDHNLDTSLDVFSLNAKAIKFYKKLGFVETGKRFHDQTYSDSKKIPLEITEMKLGARSSRVDVIS